MIKLKKYQKNAKYKKLPIEPNPITGSSAYLEECKEYYNKYSEITPNFVDQNFSDLVTNLIGED